MRLLQVLALILASTLGHAQNRLTNSRELYDLVRSSGAINPSFDNQDLSHLRIAIIDYGFEGFQRYGRELGPTVKLAKPELPQEDKHGFAMAQIFMASSGALMLPENRRPEVLLISADGYTQFKEAIDFCLGDRNHSPVNIVIHSRNFPWGSDFEGGGFFNAQVARATKAGITWINSAGNSGNTAYFGEHLSTNNKDEVILPGPKNTLVFENRFDDQSFNITLTWNDFRSDSNYATRKDLDFAVYSARSPYPLPDGVANKQQLGKQPKTAGTIISGNAFETLSIRLPERGTYFIKIFDRSKNFDARDQFRLQIDSENPEALNFISKNRIHEITAPADRSDVIAVGVPSAFSSIRLQQGQLIKPDVILDFKKTDFRFNYSDSFSTELDTSSATAVMAGIVANLMAADHDFSNQKILSYMHGLSQQDNGQGPIWVAPQIAFSANEPNPPQNAAPAMPTLRRNLPFRPIHTP